MIPREIGPASAATMILDEIVLGVSGMNVFEQETIVIRVQRALRGGQLPHPEAPHYWGINNG
jgi:hypothetical protein